MQLNEKIPFFTPIYDTMLTGIDNSFLEKQMFKYQGEDALIRLASNTGYQTKTFHNDGKDLKFLFDNIQPFVNAVSQKWGIKRELKLVNWWYSLSKKYDYGPAHYHPEGIVSGCFYVKVPKHSGNIVFERPDLQTHYFEGDVINDYNYKFFTHEAKPGFLVLFPSYLKHEIQQNLSTDQDDARISIAFNYS
jgi:uncharacterized protein (TIGR02466 family)